MASKQARKRQVPEQSNVEYIRGFQRVEPKNLAQQLYLEAIERSDVVFGVLFILFCVCCACLSEINPITVSNLL